MLSEKKFLTNKRAHSRLFHFYKTLEMQTNLSRQKAEKWVSRV